MNTCERCGCGYEPVGKGKSPRCLKCQREVMRGNLSKSWKTPDNCCRLCGEDWGRPKGSNAKYCPTCRAIRASENAKKAATPWARGPMIAPKGK